MDAKQSEPDVGVQRALEAARTGSTEALGQLLEMCRLYLLGVANQEIESQLRAKAGASDLVGGCAAQRHTVAAA